MITAFIGQISGIEDICNQWGSIRGNGKTCCMVYYLYEDFLEGRDIFTNFKTTFSTLLPAKKIIEEIKNNQEYYNKKGVSVGLTEFQTTLNSLGSPQDVIKFTSFWGAQSRKLNCDISFDLQRFLDANNRFRNQSDIILRPVKLHKNGEMCKKDRCDKDHYFIIFSLKPEYNVPINFKELVVANEVGQLYNTNEMVFDEIIIEKKKKGGEKNAI